MTFCNVVVWIIFKFRNLRVIQINLNQTRSECCVCLSLRHCLRWLLLLAIFVRLDVVRWQDWDASSCFRMAMLLPLLNVDVSPSTVGYTITVASLFSPSFRSCRLLLFGLFFFCKSPCLMILPRIGTLVLGVSAIAVCRNVGDLSVGSVSCSPCAFRDSPPSLPRFKTFGACPFGLVSSGFFIMRSKTAQQRYRGGKKMKIQISTWCLFSCHF